MAKYQGQYREELETDDTVMERPETEEQHPSVQAGDDASFKKRYGDLRRHMQTQMSQKDQQVTELQGQLAQATQKQIKFPKTDSEVAEWAKKYPDVAKIIDTIAQRRVTEGMQKQADTQSQRVSQIEQKLQREEAEKQLRRTHPDFDQIRQDEAFHEWVQSQPAMISEALYKNNSDATAASRALDLYKQDKGIKMQRKASKDGAAQSVGRTTNSAPSPRTTRFTESSVDKMSVAEYERNEDAILKSIREGTFSYDISGAAR